MANSSRRGERPQELLQAARLRERLPLGEARPRIPIGVARGEEERYDNDRTAVWRALMFTHSLQLALSGFIHDKPKRRKSVPHDFTFRCRQSSTFFAESEIQLKGTYVEEAVWTVFCVPRSVLSHCSRAHASAQFCGPPFRVTVGTCCHRRALQANNSLYQKGLKYRRPSEDRYPVRMTRMD